MSKKLIAPKPKGKIIYQKDYDKEKVYIFELPWSFTLVFDSIIIGDTTNIRIRLYKDTLAKILDSEGKRYKNVVSDRDLLYEYILKHGFYLRYGFRVTRNNRYLQWDYDDYKVKK